MTRLIRRAHQLPTWFSLAKYQALQDLTLVGWLRQFSMRAELRNARRPLKTYEQYDLEDIRARGVLPPGIDEECTNHWIGEFDWELRDNPLAGLPVRPMTVHDLLRLNDEVGPETIERGWDYQEYLRHATHAMLGEGRAEDQEDSRLLETCVDDWAPDNSNSASVVVDLGLPDEMLMRAFREKLPRLRELASDRARRELPSEARVDPAAWIRLGVLPFIDLQMWAAEIDVQITYRAFTEAIFEPGEGGEEVVRKTTAPTAAAVMSKSFLRKLVTAAVEQSRSG